jgi:hypothetical protein
MVLLSSWNFLKAKGSNIIVAKDQRKKDKASGGTSLMKALATIKFPLQMMQARMAKAIPV